jgi:sugar-phosphatase
MVRIVCGAILFDLDGVLVDSRAAVERHWRRWAKGHGLDAEAIIARAHGRRSVDTIRDVAPHLDAEREGAALDKAEAADSEGIAAIAGAGELLRTLPETAWAVVTSASRKLALARLGYAGLPAPRSLVSADDVTAGKPSPAGYLHAADLLAREPGACLVVEDTPAGIAAGQAASMRVLALTTTYEPAVLAAADFCAASLADCTLVSAGPEQLELELGSQPPS